MNCPRCNGLKLDSITVSTINLDQCRSCEGVWFDRNELRSLLDTQSKSSLSPELQKSLEGEIRQEEAPGGFHLTCPRCAGELKRYSYGYSSKVLVDGCESGCGVWIDDGELADVFDYAVRAAAELDPVTSKRINARLDALAAARLERENRFVDSLVTLDDQDGPLRPIGELLQMIASIIHRAQKKLF